MFVDCCLWCGVVVWWCDGVGFCWVWWGDVVVYYVVWSGVVRVCVGGDGGDINF